MPESGGSSNQSGISYQNLFAAYQIASMLSGQELPPTHRIESVRIEAPTSVDDIVVSFGDGSCQFV